jgi:DNA-binding CsgD family transcriptional regulator
MSLSLVEGRRGRGGVAAVLSRTRPSGQHPRVAELRGRHRERDRLDRLLDAVRAGESRVLVLRGEPGVGKTALLDDVADHAEGCRVARLAGVQSEMELAFAGVHQLCTPMLDHLQHLAAPQRAVLRTALGLNPGPAPDRFLVGLAVLGLLADAAAEKPLICLVDDEQWLDDASAQVLGFVARRLAAESVGLVFAARVPGEELTGLPELAVEGLQETDARALLEEALTGPLDPRVLDRLVAESGGNPLALLELPRGLTPAELAGGFAMPDATPLAGRIEKSFQRRLDVLPAGSRRLLQLAAADPVGEPVLVWRAAARLGIPAEAATPAAEAGLLEVGVRVLFRHPLVRSAAYRSASLSERRAIHAALAEVTDPMVDPDRRAWHRAQAAAGPDEDLAAELERSADRAQARGGLAAAAAFLERAALLSPEPCGRARRLLAAARAKRAAGALSAALRLLAEVEAGRPDPLRAAEVERLRGLIVFVQRRANDGAQLLLGAARRLAPLDVALSRETYLDALGAAIWAGDLDNPGGLRAVATAARRAPPASKPPRTVDLLLDGFTLRLTDGHAPAAPVLRRALELGLGTGGPADDADRWRWLGTGRAISFAALELWEDKAAHAVATLQTQLARDTGAPVHLQYALNLLATTHMVAGELTAAARLVEEDRLIADITGNPPAAYSAMALAAWRGQEAQASALIEATSRAATARGQGRLFTLAAHAVAVLSNGLGRHDLARDAAWRAFEHDELGFGPFVVPELAEAASRTGEVELVEEVLAWLAERTALAPSDWALGIEARVRALLSRGDAAERRYRESIARLGRTRARVELARGHLLYGEWLRRRRRRLDARLQLRIAYDLLTAMGVGAFAERARRELAATGATARRRSIPPGGELTAQEEVIARLARDGLSNPEIGTRLFISARTVQYHLHKVFTKLAINSRAQLQGALSGDGTATPR